MIETITEENISIEFDFSFSNSVPHPSKKINIDLNSNRNIDLNSYKISFNRFLAASFGVSETMYEVEHASSLEEIRKNYDLLHPRIKRNLVIFGKTIARTIAPLTKEKEKAVSKVRIVFNKGNECYTNGHTIFIGINHSAFRGILDEDFIIARYVIAHEIAHELYTDSDAWVRFCYKAPKLWKHLGVLLRDLLNILEDRRIEHILSSIAEHYKNGFLLIGSKVIKEGINLANKDLKEATFDQYEKAHLQLQVIRNLTLWTSYTRKIPKTIDSTVNDYMKKIFPIIIHSRDVKSTQEICDCVESIMDILDPLYQLAHEHSERIEGAFVFRNGLGSKTPIIETGDEEEGDLYDIAKIGEAIVKANSKDEDDEFEDKEKEETLSGDIEEEEDKKDPSTKIINPSHTPKEEEEEEEDYLQDDYFNNINASLDNFVYDENFEHEPIEDFDSIESTVLSDFSISTEVYNDYLKQKERTEALSMKEYTYGEIIDKIGDPVIPNLHKHCRPLFMEKHKIPAFSKAEYFGLKKQISPLITSTSDKLKEILGIEDEDVDDNAYSGSITSRGVLEYLMNNRSDVFEQRQSIDEPFQASFMLLIDNSGSQQSLVQNQKNGTRLPRYALNRLVAIFLHEVLKSIEFQHAVWTFHSSGRGVEEFSSILDKSNCFEEDSSLRLKGIGAYGSNRDGYSIRIAGEYFKKEYSDETKIMFVISDGQPASDNYSGAVAINDIRETTDQLIKDGVKVIGIFTGDESENVYFKDMYKNHIFVNNESIFDLPNVIQKEIIKVISNG